MTVSLCHTCDNDNETVQWQDINHVNFTSITTNTLSVVVQIDVIYSDTDIMYCSKNQGVEL